MNGLYPECRTVSDGGSVDTLLEVRDLRTYFYTRYGVVKAVDGISFEVKRGEKVALVGESGSGKSVTALSILRLVPKPGRVVQGEILFDGRDLLQISEATMRQTRGSRISMIFQEPVAHLNPVLPVGRQIAEVLVAHQGMRPKAALRRSEELIDMVGIPDASQRARQYSHQLSGGMCQRIIIAMALACSPQLLIADEPTTALDVTIEAQVLELMKKLTADFGTSVILVTHNLGIVADWADRIDVMYFGRIVESAPKDDLYYDARHPYSKGLLVSIPRLDRPREARLKAIDGTPPDVGQSVSGCAFHPRCSVAIDHCTEECPPLARIDSTEHWCACWRQSN